MAIDQKSLGFFGSFLGAWGLMTLVWAMSYGYATWRLDDCSHVRTVSTASLQADVARLKSAVDIEKHRREAVPR
jgi:hypothetical protein